MGELRLYAIAIDDVRDMFGAPAETADRLRKLAADALRTAPEPARPQGLLGKLGPLLRRPADAPVVPDGAPLPSDVETLLVGRYVQPDRLAACWQVVETWLEHESRGMLRVEMTPAGLEQVEFELARAGLASDHALGRLMMGDARLGLRPAPGMRVGYAKNAHLVATAQALRQCLDQVQQPVRERVEPVADFLGSCELWSAAPGTEARNDQLHNGDQPLNGDGEQTGAPDLLAILDDAPR